VSHFRIWTPDVVGANTASQYNRTFAGRSDPTIASADVETLSGKYLRIVDIVDDQKPS
jgi:hypothetical protein